MMLSNILPTSEIRQLNESKTNGLRNIIKSSKISKTNDISKIVRLMRWKREV